MASRKNPTVQSSAVTTANARCPTAGFADVQHQDLTPVGSHNVLRSKMLEGHLPQIPH